MEKQDLETKNKLYREAILEVLEENQYLDNYLYAEYIIKTFINDERSFQRSRFYRIARINKYVFNYCIETIKFLNPCLYKEYLEAEGKGEEKKKAFCEKSIVLLANAIRTGHLEDGSKFDILDFYRFVPLREKGFNFVPELIRFMEESSAIDDEDKNTIIKFMEDNEITRIVFTSKNSILENSEVMSVPGVNGEVINNLFKYMLANGLPNIEHAFMIVFNRYLNEEIDFGDLDRMSAKSKKNKFNKYYKNPYRLQINHKLK